MLGDILNNILEERNITLSSGAFFVLHQLVESDFDGKGKSWPGIARLMKLTHQKESAVRLHLRQLEKRELITTEIVRGRGNSNIYTFNFTIEKPSKSDGFKNGKNPQNLKKNPQNLNPNLKLSSSLRSKRENARAKELTLSRFGDKADPAPLTDDEHEASIQGMRKFMESIG